MTRVTAVRERPILFSPEMVRAILEGRKTQTRRVLMPQPPRIAGLYARDGRWYMPPGEPAAVTFPRCPYGQPGDRLWVRETRGWRGSIIMLEITDVRVERVQEISEADARAEGMIEQPYRRQYAALWDRWYDHRGYGWDTNPWVWVLTFRRVNGPVRHDLDVRTAAGRTTRGAARDDAQV